MFTVREEVRVLAAHDLSRKERGFWLKADSTEYFYWTGATPMRSPDLRPSSTAMSVRLPEMLLTELKLLANERDVPYQRLSKVYLIDRVQAESRRAVRRMGRKGCPRAGGSRLTTSP